MKKVNFLFWAMFSSLVIFALGIQFAYSQFATSTPSTGVSHDSSDIVCNDCINSANIGVGAVGSGEVLDGAIINADVSSSALIHTSKLDGDNGWYVPTGVLANVNQWYPAPVTSSLGISSWSGKTFEMICGSAAEISVGTGTFVIGSTSIYRNNHKISTFTAGTQTEVYRASDSAPWPSGSQRQTLEVRFNPASPAQLEFRRTWTPGSIIGAGTSCGGSTCEPQYTQFYCVLKLISN
ncbi:MAG: hypothetical protein ACP5NS_02165 [Candidatus Pacearchaeota archaeon]